MRKYIIRLLAIMLTSITVSQATVLMLDFGSTAPYNETNSPYHSVNSSFTDTSWTMVSADVSSGVVWSDGTSASGVTIDVGDSLTASTVINLASSVSTSALGGQAYDGIYDGPAKDGIFSNTGTTSPNYVGVQISGLAAGMYEIYLSGRNTSTSLAHDQTLLVGTSAGGNFDVAGYSSANLYYPTFTYVGGGITSWIPESSDGENYVKFIVTLDEGDSLNLASIGSTGYEKRGFLNTAQIVAIPEPAAVGLFLSGAAFTIMLRRLSVV